MIHKIDSRQQNRVFVAFFVAKGVYDGKRIKYDISVGQCT